MRRNTEIKADEVTFNTLMDGCARYGLFDRGLHVLMDARHPRSVLEGSS